MNNFSVEILTPFGKYLESNEINFLQFRNEKFSYGISAGHSPLITTIEICILEIKFNNTTYQYAVSSGVIYVSKNKTTIIVNSIERKDEIDLERAKLAKERALKRLNNKTDDPGINVARAEASLLRALNRLSLFE